MCVRTCEYVSVNVYMCLLLIIFLFRIDIQCIICSKIPNYFQELNGFISQLKPCIQVLRFEIRKRIAKFIIKFDIGIYIRQIYVFV